MVLGAPAAPLRPGRSAVVRGVRPAHRALALDNAQLHEQVQAAVRARDEFIALAAHELHSPLASLQLAADSLVKRAGARPHRTKICRAWPSPSRTRARRLTRLVDHMLDVVADHGAQAHADREQVDFSRLLRELAPTFEELAARARCKLDWSIEDKVVGSWDEDRLSQLVSNLLDNAIKFGAGKPVDISLRSEAATRVLQVRDEGHRHSGRSRGVDLRSVRARGVRAQLRRARARAVHGQGDHRRARRRDRRESEPDKGATFTVRLPRASTLHAHAPPAELH